MIQQPKTALTSARLPGQSRQSNCPLYRQPLVCCLCYQGCSSTETSHYRRAVLFWGVQAGLLASAQTPPPALALGFKKEPKRKKIPEKEYASADDGSKTYDLSEGSGTAVKAGSKVKVHFDAMYKGIDVASSRSARLLGGNRTLAEPLEFVAGKPVTSDSIAKDVDAAGGLYSGIPGPKPPPVLGTAVVGMKRGGKRSVLVPPELGYGKDGLLEIPPNSQLELQIEVLSVG